MRVHGHQIDLPNIASLGEILVTLWEVILYAAKTIVFWSASHLGSPAPSLLAFVAVSD